MCSRDDDPTTYEPEVTTVATFQDALREAWGDEYDDTLRDLARHGAEGGFPGLTYYRETVALYDAHGAEIWEALAEDADDMGLAHPLALVASFGGAGNVYSAAQLANLLVWYMAERIASAADRD